MRVGELIARRRAARDMSQDDLARRLIEASGRTTLDREVISRWERDKRIPGPFWLNYIAEVLEVPLSDLRKSVQFTKRLRRNSRSSFDEGLSLLLSADVPKAGSADTKFFVDSVERLLVGSYSLDDELGGGSLCRQIGTNVKIATSLFSNSLTLTQGDRLRRAVGALAQIGGWLSIDTNHHVDSNKYLTAALYSSYETEDNAMAAHILGYMSLHALYRDRTREAVSLAHTSVDGARASQMPELDAILNARLARCKARLGDGDACQRALDKSAQAFGRTVTGDRPPWLQYVDAVELAAQRGACFLDLGRGAEAAEETEQAISLLQLHTPNRIRDLAHYKVRLASAYVLQHDLERAMSATREAYDLIVEIDSPRVSGRFLELVDHLTGFDSAVVLDTLESFDLRLF